MDAAPATSVVTDAGATVLASGQLAPFGIAIDSQNVYWMNYGQDNTTNTKEPVSSTGAQVMKCAIGGCANLPTVLAGDRQIGAGRAFPAALASDGENVYWYDETPDNHGGSGGLFKCAVGGCDGVPSNIGPNAGYLAVYAGRVYWTEFEATVSSCSTAGCDSSMSSIWSAGYSPVAIAIAVDDSGVYWTNGAPDAVRTCALSGCNNTPTVLDPKDTVSASLRAIALDRDNVYFADTNPVEFGLVMKCPKSGCIDGAPTVLASGLSTPNAIATDGAFVYWTEQGDTTVNGKSVPNVGSIRRCAVTGCPNGPTTIASAVNQPMGIAIDAHSVYWTEQGATPGEGRIMYSAK